MSIFEIVEASDDETYWPLGVFASLSDAAEAIALGPEDFGNPLDRDDSITIEIRERTFGWNPCETGKVVMKKTWTHDWPEDGEGDAIWREVK